MPSVSQLSALPHFLRGEEFWRGMLNPKKHLGNDSHFRELRSATGAHRWAIDVEDAAFPVPSKPRLAILDVAQSILERGNWTIPTWRVEQVVAGMFRDTQGWQFEVMDPNAGSLGFKVRDAPVTPAFEHALVTARWQREFTGDAVNSIWLDQPEPDAGSTAERAFLEDVLVPTLGFPLLDFLQLQPDLVSMGLEYIEFSRQRTDFALDNHRGLKLVIEVDGGQHRELAQRRLDGKRDAALAKQGWVVWRVPTDALSDKTALREKLASLLKRRDGKPHWGASQLVSEPRDRTLLSCVWGATVIARIQFLLLEALRVGVLPWDSPWEVVVAEHDTDVSSEALADLADWFGRLRELHGESGVPSIAHVTEPRVGSTHLRLDIAVRDPRRPFVETTLPVAWSRPANVVAPVPKRKFASRMTLAEPPRQELVESFVQDYFRKSSLREGQYEILARILTGQDVVGLLPTGGGKSLTYQVAGLLLGGLTIYVSPLKSLLQDQHERLVDLGIELAQPISSALDADQRARANALLTSGGIRYLLIAPERFLIESFRHNLNQFRAQYGEVCQVVIDECHCVSEWGHDFRPAYLSLSRIVKERTERLGVSAPLIALTGTASTIVLADVQRELGIVGAESVIRARRLDRDEIALECVKLPQKDKHHAIRDLASRFLTEHPDPNEGLLVFCRFAGGVDGVLGVTADIQAVAGTDDIRFFCGSDPKWEQYAAIWTRTPARKLSREQVMAHVPNWALTPNNELRDWEDVKAEVQRQYISGLPGSFRVMVATNAFGMGIDKPSVRQVIHFMTPQAPEAYYQEVGRAGRDRKASSAILMFSDEEPALADELLSPERTIDEVRSTYKAFAETNRFKGGDFIRTFYFHQNAFAGPEIEVEYVTQLLGEIRAKLATESSLSFPYCPDVTNRESDLRAPERLNSEKSLEYAIVRLVLLGVVRDYVKDYNGKTFELMLASEWRARCDDTQQLAEYVWEHFQRYVRRYQFRVADNGGQQIRNADTVDGVERAAASAMVQYVYNQIERTRRQASRQMLELARKGVRSADEFRRDLMLYLQASEKFTNDLEALVQADDLHAWVEVVERVSSPDEVKELHGACSRVLESYPTHVGLLCISAVTRLARGEEELRLSEEELRAALRQAVDVYGVDEAKAVGDAVTAVSGAFDVGPAADGLRSVFGLWLLQQGRLQESVERFFGQRRVRDAWLGSVLREARRELPPVEGL